jgi:RimJ/RimL family protein N-acetyltransferase
MPFLAPESIVTDRLELRQFTLADHAQFARISADPQVMQYIGTGEIHGADMAWRAIAGFLGHWQLLGYGQWAVTLRDSGLLIGRVGFFDPHGWPGFELGWLLAREHWGRGYAREAASVALRVARRELRKERVISLIRAQNEPSIKLALALGAQHESTIDFLSGQAEVYVHTQ